MLYGRILFVYSHVSELESDAFNRALALQNEHGSQLDILCICPELKMPAQLKQQPPSIDAVQEKIVKAKLDELNDAVGNRVNQASHSFNVRFGHIYLEAIKYCLENSISLLLKAAKNPSWLDYLFDSEDMHLFRKCPVPVWLTKEKNNEVHKHLIVALDFDHVDEFQSSSQLNDALLSNAIDIAQREKARLHILNVYDASYVDFATMWADDPQQLERDALNDEKVTRQSLVQATLTRVLKQKQMSEEDFDFDIRLVEGNPKQQIAKTVKAIGADMVIMGSVGRTGIAGLIIGNTAESTLLQLNCSVLVIKPEGFVSPVDRS